MRYIDPALKAKLELANQTLYNNANLSMEVEAVRARTAIYHQRFWQESIVTAGVTAVCSSVVIRRTGRWGDTVYVAYVDSAGLLTVKSAPLRFPIRSMSWTTVTTIAGCTACALEFEGHFVHAGRNVEFRTDSTPYLASVTAAGALYVGLLGGSYEPLAASGVTAVDMINGVSNTYDAQNQGFFVFYIVEGVVYYNTYLDGWEGQQAVSIAPANAVSIKAERTFDYRIVLQVTDNTGALYEVFTKMEATGWNGTEFTELVGISLSSYAITPIAYLEFQNEEAANLKDITLTDQWLMADYSPTLQTARNFSIEMEYPEGMGEGLYNDWGYLVEFVFDQVVRNAEAFPADFVLEDDTGYKWYGQEAYKSDPHSLSVFVLFTNFNNAVNDLTAIALAGNLWNGYEMLTETSKVFTANGLVPTAIPSPVPISISNTDNRTIILEFDLPIVSINSQSGFVVSGYEPLYSPDGDLVETTYGISSIEYLAAVDDVPVDLEDGSLTDTVFADGLIKLAEDT